MPAVARGIGAHLLDEYLFLPCHLKIAPTVVLIVLRRASVQPHKIFDLPGQGIHRYSYFPRHLLGFFREVQRFFVKCRGSEEVQYSNVGGYERYSGKGGEASHRFIRHSHLLQLR